VCVTARPVVVVVVVVVEIGLRGGGGVLTALGGRG